MKLLEWLFPGDQLEVLREMITLFVLFVVITRWRAEIYDRLGLGSIVFFTEQKFQTIFGNRNETAQTRTKSRGGRRKKRTSDQN
ncbi:MAG TPA: hypothetical protein VD837_01620 [Terriglobales bacterium]|nr:hypothetical protein [Terriglobales bacterium]